MHRNTEKVGQSVLCVVFFGRFSNMRSKDRRIESETKAEMLEVQGEKPTLQTFS